ncbi:MAG: RNA-binding protein [Candidatus Methanomethylophilaceae archaeon]|nr:RNA-binding protein [Candidatus Methanomethylophilaceae archaeon]
MQSTFRWIRVRVMCYATENKEKVSEMFKTFIGTDEWNEDVVEGELGNITVVMDAELSRQKPIDEMFAKLGQSTIDGIIDELDERIDEDCTFYIRLDKQKAISGSYIVATGGDVVSLTCKIASYPAKKELAVDILKKYLGSLPRSAPELP